MTYSSIQDLAKNFGTSERTIYSYLKKFSQKVRTKRDNGSLYVHFNDFFGITSNRLKKFYNASKGTQNNTALLGFGSSEITPEEIPKNFTRAPETMQNFGTTSEADNENAYLKTIQAIEVKYEKLQSKVEAMQSQNEQLNKAKQNFEEQASKYGLMYKEEQSEKKVREGKFLDLQENHTTFRIKMERIVTGLIVVLSIFLLAFGLLYFLGAISLEFSQS